jgi:hypothetical protein
MSLDRSMEGPIALKHARSGPESAHHASAAGMHGAGEEGKRRAGEEPLAGSGLELDVDDDLVSLKPCLSAQPALCGRHPRRTASKQSFEISLDIGSQYKFLDGNKSKIGRWMPRRLASGCLMLKMRRANQSTAKTQHQKPARSFLSPSTSKHPRNPTFHPFRDRNPDHAPLSNGRPLGEKLPGAAAPRPGIRRSRRS